MKFFAASSLVVFALLGSLVLGSLALGEQEEELIESETPTPFGDQGGAYEPDEPPDEGSTEPDDTAEPSHNHTNSNDSAGGDWFLDGLQYELRSLYRAMNRAMGNGDPYCERGPDCLYDDDPRSVIDGQIGRCGKLHPAAVRSEVAEFDPERHDEALTALERACDSLSEARARLGPGDRSQAWLDVMSEVSAVTEEVLEPVE